MARGSQPEKAFANEGGACGCCGVETLVDAARPPADLVSLCRRDDPPRCDVADDRAAGRVAPVTLQPWELPACPMTTFAMAAAPDGIVAAWETRSRSTPRC